MNKIKQEKIQGYVITILFLISVICSMLTFTMVLHIDNDLHKYQNRIEMKYNPTGLPITKAVTHTNEA